MKGLSLTLTIVIIAIVLLVTALVVITIFSSEITRIMAALGIFSTDAIRVNLCEQKCTTYCQLNPGSVGPGGTGGWGSLEIQLDPNAAKEPCSGIMVAAGKPVCTCRTLGTPAPSEET